MTQHPPQILNVALPPWLSTLRKRHITAPCLRKNRSGNGLPLGLPLEQARRLINYGQARFDQGCPEKGLRPEDIVLLYAYYNQLQHLEELIAILGYLREKNDPTRASTASPIIIDLGCGPFTGGLAASEAFKGLECDYIGWDTSEAMQQLGGQLAEKSFHTKVIKYPFWALDLGFWARNRTKRGWHKKRGQRPVLVIMSYLLGSETLDVKAMMNDLIYLLNRISRGDVKVLYTNSISEEANMNYSDLVKMLYENDFQQEKLFDGDIVRINATRFRGNSKKLHSYTMRCALFHRPKNPSDWGSLP